MQKKHNFKPALLAVALVGCFATAAQAAEEPVNQQELGPVVVTASRVEQLQKDAIPNTQVISSETLQKKKLADVLTILRNEAGIDFTRNGGRGTTSAVYMRGFSPTQLLVMIDGVPVSDSNSMTTESLAFLSGIDPNQIDHIEVVKGNVSSIYGSGAMGGVIQIFTKRGIGEPTANFFAEYGSDNTYKYGASASGTTEGGTSFSFSANQYRTDGFSAINHHDKGFESANNDDDYNRTINFNGAISQKLNENHEIGVRLYSYDSHFGYDSSWGSEDDKHEGKSKQTTAAIYSKNHWTQNWMSTITASYSDVEKDYFYTSYGYPDKYGYETKTATVQWDNQYALNADWTLTGGLTYANEEGEATGSDAYKSVNRSKYSAYVGALGNMGNHHIQANVRYDYVEDADNDTTGYLGYSFDLTDEWKLLASASTAFQAPNLYQQYSSSGNKKLESEKTTNYEGGIQYASGKTVGRLTYFEWRGRDLIEYDYSVPNPKAYWGYGAYNNINRAKNKGVEFTGKTEIFSVDLGAHFTWQDPKDRETGKQLVGRAKWIGGLDVSKTWGNLYVGADLQYTGHRMYSNREMSSYTLLNLNARYDINKHVSIYGRIENLFDKDYETVYGYEQPGIGVFGGINVKM